MLWQPFHHFVFMYDTLKNYALSSGSVELFQISTRKLSIYRKLQCFNVSMLSQSVMFSNLFSFVQFYSVRFCVPFSAELRHHIFPARRWYNRRIVKLELWLSFRSFRLFNTMPWILYILNVISVFYRNNHE